MTGLVKRNGSESNWQSSERLFLLSILRRTTTTSPNGFNFERSNKYEDFDNKFEYIDYLEDNGLITHGCALCMIGYGPCNDATKKFASVDEPFIDCIPLSHIGINRFPVSCLREWYGDEYIENLNSEEEI